MYLINKTENKIEKVAEKSFSELGLVGYALDSTYHKRLCFRVRPSRTPFIRYA